MAFYINNKGRSPGDTESDRKARKMERKRIRFKRMSWSKVSKIKEALRRMRHQPIRWIATWERRQVEGSRGEKWRER